MSDRSWYDEAEPEKRRRGERSKGDSVVGPTRPPGPATAGVAWLTLGFAILACILAAVAMVRAGEARDAARGVPLGATMVETATVAPA
ncbi:hypothetical protein [Nitriliruptor alkaliphilus]|uniref:hypothetical protein n=1 Tax=Nitriliruptor alkaliphilus TaxID=427918 RepID=UPI000697BE1B|nr:hypothetical protein [Nitriliruptor alkaliphilus]